MKKKIISTSKMQETSMRDKLRLSIKQEEEGKVISFTYEEFMKFSKKSV